MGRAKNSSRFDSRIKGPPVACCTSLPKAKNVIHIRLTSGTLSGKLINSENMRMVGDLANKREKKF